MLKHYSSFCFIFCLFLPLMSKADFERVVRPLRNGTLVLNSRCRASLMRFTPEWKPVSQYQARSDAGYPRSSAERFELRGTFDAFRMNEVVTATSSNAFHYSMELSAENPVPCNLLFLGINLPLGKGIRVEIDGKPVAMPEQYKTKKVFDASAQSVTVKDPQGEFTITGNCHLILIGKFLRDGEEYYQLRLLPAGKHPKTVKFWKLELDFQLHFSRPGIDSQPIDLATLFNRGFRSGEGAPAWTGQGAAQEPRTLQPGEYRFHGIRIHIADPGRNHGRTCLILGRDLGPKSAGVDIANFPEQAKYLYLFHAAAWPPMLLKPLGAIELSYEDGSRETVPVIAGRDCDNWFRPPMTLPNASPVWKTELAGFSAGLYLSAFPLKKPVKRINFRLSSASSAAKPTSLCTRSWQPSHSPAMFPIVLEPFLDRGTIWWYWEMAFLHIRHFPACRSLTAAWRSSNPFNGPFWKSTPEADGFSMDRKANRFTSMAMSVTGRYFWIFRTRPVCVRARCPTVGVCHPSGRLRLQKRASVFRMTIQVRKLSAAYCGSFRILIPARMAVPYFFASRWRAFRSPFREALRHWRRLPISFAISLFLVSATAENRSSPFGERAARPILERPGSTASITGCRTGSFL